MVLFGHAAVGTIIGGLTLQYVEAPTAALVALVFFIGWVSHYAMDFVPHGHYLFDTGRLKESSWLPFLADTSTILALAGAGLLFNSFSSEAIVVFGVAVFGALWPDGIHAALNALHLKPMGVLVYEKRLHRAVHWHSDRPNSLPNGARPWTWTDVWQIAMLGLAAWVLLAGNYA